MTRTAAALALAAVLVTGVACASATVLPAHATGLGLLAAQHVTGYALDVPPRDRTAPAAPSVAAIAGETSVDLTWTADPDVDHYVVTVDGGSATTVHSTTWSVSELTAGVEYQFAVVAVDSYWNVSTPGTAVATPTAPPDPSP